MKCRSLGQSRGASLLALGRVGLFLVGVIVCSNAALGQGNADYERLRKLYQSIQWQEGPCTVQVGSVAELVVPKGYAFTGPAGAATLAIINENPPSDSAGVLIPTGEDSNWELHFEFDKIGYVKDDEKESLDAKAILESFRAGTEASNKYRRQQGWSELHVAGWITPPAYDEKTNNLEWGLRLKSDDGFHANYDIRLLGRRGVMRVTLVTSPEEMESTVPVVQRLLTGYHFKQNESHAEFRAGDKVAQYGLTGLIVGGGVVAAAKTGLLAKLGVLFAKAGKAIFIGIAALGAGIWKLLTGRSGSRQES